MGGSAATHSSRRRLSQPHTSARPATRPQLDFGGGGPCYLQWEQASMGTGFDRYCVLTPGACE